MDVDGHISEESEEEYKNESSLHVDGLISDKSEEECKIESNPVYK